MNPNLHLREGDVVRYNDPTVQGREQKGERTAVVLRTVSHSLCIIILTTSQQHHLGKPFVVRLEPTATNGLDKISGALIVQLRSISTERISVRAGTLDPNIFLSVRDETKRFFRF